ncbi:MAG: caspase family protein [Nostoc sp.]|uniref:nSTAND1 domain-containing NTPase n=1 Tax=Nostoc sp. TaxID=1180 RepID=UPI002FF4E9A0
MAKINRSLGIVIGINEYTHIPKLKSAVNDAKELADVLEKRYKYKVLRLVEDGDATSEKLSNLLKNLDNRIIQIGDELIKVEESDRVLFYFAGHGFPEETEDSEDRKPAGYLMSQDSQQNDKSTWVSMQSLHDALTGLDCRHLLMILDCCFAGRILWAGLKRNAGRSRKMYQQSYDRFIKSSAQQVITSAAYDEEAADLSRIAKREGGENGHSPFAGLLLKVLNAKQWEVDKDASLKTIIEDGVITAQELFTYLQNNLGHDAEKQTPGLFHLKKHDKGEYIFELPDFKRERLEEFKLDDSTNPYKGLASFETKDSELFLGRKRLIEGSKDPKDPKYLEKGLLSEVSNHRFTVVLGNSGSGKSSLVKAGLIPVLKPKEWYVLNPIRPGEFPITALARAILPIKNVDLVDQLAQVNFLDDILKSKTKQELKSRLNDENKEKFNILVKAWESSIPEAKLLLVLDYFEHLEKLCSTNSEKQQLENLKQNILKTLKLLIDELKPDSQACQSLTAIVKQWSAKDKNIKLLLMFDQSEELITLCRNDKEREWFLQLLAEALASQEISDTLCIVLTLRTDYEPQIRDLNKNKGEKADWQEAWQKVWQDGRFIVTPMNREELQQVIEEPAKQRTLDFESPKLVNSLIEEVNQNSGALPLLSFTLSELYLKYLKAEENRERNDRIITEADYQEIGGVTRALTQTADKTYNKLVEEEVDEQNKKACELTIRDVMLRMVAISSGEPARRRIPTSELIYPGQKNERANKVIDRFVEARLLVKGLDTQNQPYVEPAHDALVRGWQKLREWEQKERENLLLQRRLTPATQDWERVKNKDKEQPKGILDRAAPIFDWLDRKFLIVENSVTKIPISLEPLFQFALNQLGLSRQTAVQFLWNANPYLEVLDKELNTDDNWFNQVEAEFVQQSVLKKRWNISWWWRITGLFILILFGLLMWALWNLGLSKINEAKTLRESAEINLQKNQSFDGRDDSLKAGKILNNIGVQLLLPLTFNSSLKEQVRGTLLRAVYTVRELDRQEADQGMGTVRTTFSPDGKLLASAGENCNVPVRVWDFQSQTLSKSNLIKFKDKPDKSDNFYNKNNCEPVKITRFSQNSQQLAVAGAKGTVGVWDLRREDKELIKLKIWATRQGQVKSISFSPDGKLLATAGAEGTVHIWNLDNFSEISESKSLCVFNSCEKKQVWSVAFSPDGKRLASTGDNGAIRLWDRKGNEWKENIIFNIIKEEGKDQITSVSFSPDGQKLATAGTDGIILIWDLKNAKLVKKQVEKKIPTNQNTVWEVAFSPDGKKLASAGQDGTVRLWDLNKSESDKSELDKFEGHHGPVRSVSFNNRNHQELASAGDDGSVRLWNLQGNESKKVAVSMDALTDKPKVVEIHDGKQTAEGNKDDTGTVKWTIEKTVQQMRSSHVGKVTCLVFIPDSNQLASGGMDGTIRLWNKEGEQKNLLPIYAPVNDLAYSADKKLLASAGNDGMVQLWNLQDLKNGEPFAAWKAYHSLVTKVSFSSDGKDLITAGKDSTDSTDSTTGLCKLWPIESFDNLMKQADKKVNPVNGDLEKSHLCEGIGTPVPTPTSPEPSPVKSLDPKAAKEISELKGHQGSVRSVAFSPNSQTLATSGDDGTIRLWNTKGQQIFKFQGNQTAIGSINFSPNGQKLVSDAGGKIRLWDLQGKLLREFVASQKPIGSVKFNPNNGQQLASTGDDGIIHLWNLQGQSLAKWQADPKRVWDLAFNPDGQQIASAEAGGSVSLWNLKGQLMKKLTGHISPVLSVAFSPDGKQLVSGCNVGMIRSWSLPNYQMTNMFHVVNQAELNSVAYSHDGKLVISGDNEGNIKLWKLNTQQQSPTWTTHQNSIIRKVAFSPDGKMFATAADDGIVKLWQLE